MTPKVVSSSKCDGAPASNLPQLPFGWYWTTLETVAAIEGGITKDQKKAKTGRARQVPYLRVANVQRGYLDLSEIKTILADENEIDALRLKNGDILFTEGGDRDKLGRGWIWSGELEECIHQNHIFRARLLSPLLEPKFISFHGNFFGQDWFSKTGKQTTNLASINKGVLRRFPVPIAPSNEQRRIVAKIEELFSGLDAGVAALERVRANLKRYRASVLKAAVEGRLTAEWRAKHPNLEPASKLLEHILAERRRKWEADQLAEFKVAGKAPPKGWEKKYEAPTAPDTGNLPELPKGWCWAILEAISEIVGGITKDQKKANIPGMREVPYLRVANVQRGFLDLAEMKTIHASAEDIAALRLVNGDILFTEGGDRDKLGRGWVWSCEISECIHQNHIFRARLFNPAVQPRFVSHFGNTFGKSWFTKAGKQTTNLASINLRLLRRFPVPVIPAKEQAQIIAILDEELSKIDRAGGQIVNGLRRATCLRQCILKQAFEGNLVPQDPKDEPAEMLLARIQAGQCVAPGGGRERRSGMARGKVAINRERG